RRHARPRRPAASPRPSSAPISPSESAMALLPPRPSLGDTNLSSYVPIMLMIGAALTFAIGNVVLTLLIGPRRQGERKGLPYESGMNPVGTARKRFNVRFYLVAMVYRKGTSLNSRHVRISYT